LNLRPPGPKPGAL